MLSRIRINEATLFFADARMQSIEWASMARIAVKGFMVAAHRSLMVLGAAAIAALCVMFFKPDLADRLKALSPFSEAAGAQPAVASAPPASLTAKAIHSSSTREASDFGAEEELSGIGTSREQQWITNWLSKRYHVASQAANMLVSASYLTAKDTKLDPLLILAVMCIESGLNPFAESAMGAQGLMQVMSKVHHEKFKELGGVEAALNPLANIKVGSLILKDYVARGGSIEAGLKLYVGAAAFDNDAGYGSKVLAEYHRLKEVAAGKNVPVMVSAPTALKPHAQDGEAESQPAPRIESDSEAQENPPVADSANQIVIL